LIWQVKLKTSHGYHRADCNNMEMINVFQGSGIKIHSPSIFTTTNCTFSNSNSSNSKCKYLYYSLYSMASANIVHKQTENSSNHSIVMLIILFLRNIQRYYPQNIYRMCIH